MYGGMDEMKKYVLFFKYLKSKISQMNYILEYPMAECSP